MPCAIWLFRAFLKSASDCTFDDDADADDDAALPAPFGSFADRASASTSFFL